ncbi:MAG: 2-amino-4-hydroxy-6-hydroxymethyldihydropteridine diphosphokinase [Vagococcus sp.]|uniref:2-amino-4-hydroxy-6- hydroxymethyldihydropteridine diphosphokinase n=1 Tax=Vagococcus sp. TaxID=1933889 RepID=UPI002FCC06E8
MPVAYLALGSNLGDSLVLLKDAVSLLSNEKDIIVSNKSKIYETEPYGGVSQDNFLNAVVKIETSLTPIELLDVIQEIEIKLGRERIIRWGPRTIDIDILLMEGIEMTSERLNIPHIELVKRSFVLIPLKDVYENKTLFGESIDQLIEDTGNKDDVWQSKESW